MNLQSLTARQADLQQGAQAISGRIANLEQELERRRADLLATNGAMQEIARLINEENEAGRAQAAADEAAKKKRKPKTSPAAKSLSPAKPVPAKAPLPKK